MANTINSSTIDNMLSTWFGRSMIEMLGEGIATVETSGEATMPQMQPKDILVHLEKGDRTEEFIDPLNMMQEGVEYRGLLTNDQILRMQQSGQIQRISMASSSINIGQMGGPFRW